MRTDIVHLGGLARIGAASDFATGDRRLQDTSLPGTRVAGRSDVSPVRNMTESARLRRIASGEPLICSTRRRGGRRSNRPRRPHIPQCLLDQPTAQETVKQNTGNEGLAGFQAATMRRSCGALRDGRERGNPHRRGLTFPLPWTHFDGNCRPIFAMEAQASEEHRDSELSS
jgi:hypothetical protein